MENESQPPEKKSDSEHNSLPVREWTFEDVPIGIETEGKEPTPEHPLGTEGPQEYSQDKKTSTPQPLRVDVVRDEELSNFERKTVFFGIIGVFLALFSLIAASVAAYFVFHQFKEMEYANTLSDLSAQRARHDSAESTLSTNKQLAALQAQIAQQQALFNVTERAWISVWGTSFFYTKNSSNIWRADSNIIIKNTGISPAFSIRVWRCGKIRETMPTIGKEPKADPGCAVQKSGLLGGGTIDTYEIPDITQAVVPNTLPDSTLAPGRHFYVWGKITYKVLGDRTEHFTNFCLVNGPANAQMGSCAKGNYAN